MATLRTVTFSLLKPDGTAWADQVLRFELRPGSQEGDDLFPSASVRTAVSDVNGAGSIELWCNDVGDLSSEYSVQLPSREVRYFILPVGDGSPIPLADLIAIYAGPSDPNFTTLRAYVD